MANATIWILGDQLIQDHPALIKASQQYPQEDLVILMIESEARARRLPYHSKKLILLFSAMRHYASELISAGYRMDYRIARNTTSAIQEHLHQYQPTSFYTMDASEYRGRLYQHKLNTLIPIPIHNLPNTQFITGCFTPIPNPQPGKRYTQESFYRKMRQHLGLLMRSDGEPLGGKWNYDTSNRQRLPGDIQPLAPLSFEPDPITQEIIQEVMCKFPSTGTAVGFNLAVTRQQAQAAVIDFLDNRLPDFGAYEDAMSSKFNTLFHSKLSPYLNLGLLDPLQLAREAEERYYLGLAPLNSVEGFIRQVIGWREYMYWQYWRLFPDLDTHNFWQSSNPLPGFFWTGNTELNCLRNTIHRALQDGYTHHIERLMILCNFCLLAGIDPQAVNEWFLSTYIDAYEWVMLPNVFGMGLYADGGLTATKPYAASANYIRKMSDYCAGCSFDQKQRSGDTACPFNYLYWNFIIRNLEKLKLNPRMAMSLLALKNLDPEQRNQVMKSAEIFLGSL